MKSPQPFRNAKSATVMMADRLDRQDDPDERLPFGRAVDPGGLQQSFGRPKHERAQDQDANGTA